MNIDNVKVEMYPNTAIVTGNYHVKGVYASKPYEHFGRFTTPGSSRRASGCA